MALDPPLPGDDWTFRPTVIIRQGNSQGSGSVISSVRGEALILTAAHVVSNRGKPRVEFHRYNVGMERTKSGEGWPRSYPAEVVGADRAADVAVIRVRGLPPLPYVARLASPGGEPRKGSRVTSVGIDLGTQLSSWPTQITRIERFEMQGGGSPRLFLVTGRAPEHGRSGGGLYLANGDLVGVCIGRARLGKGKGRVSGIFASTSSIRRLLQLHNVTPQVESPIAATHHDQVSSKPSLSRTSSASRP